MTIFLKSCAYGTLAGAALGLATLATSENPSGKMSNVARGASLGLYAGIGFGVYTIYGKKDHDSDLVQQSPIWFSPVTSQSGSLPGSPKIDGLQINWASISF